MILENSSKLTDGFDNMGNIKALDSVIENLAMNSNLKDSYIESQIKKSWSKILGEIPAKHINISRLKENILYLYTNSSTWRTELRLREKEIIKDINNLIKESKIESIIVR